MGPGVVQESLISKSWEGWSWSKISLAAAKPSAGLPARLQLETCPICMSSVGVSARGYLAGSGPELQLNRSGGETEAGHCHPGHLSLQIHVWSS